MEAIAEDARGNYQGADVRRNGERGGDDEQSKEAASAHISPPNCLCRMTQPTARVYPAFAD